MSERKALSDHELALHVIHVVEDVDAGVLTLEDMMRLAQLHPDATLTLARAYEAQRSEVGTQKKRAEELETALSTLITRLDFIHANEIYKGVWLLYQNHNGPYQGPQYKEELDRAREALSAQEAK